MESRKERHIINSYHKKYFSFVSKLFIPVSTFVLLSGSLVFISCSTSKVVKESTANVPTDTIATYRHNYSNYPSGNINDASPYMKANDLNFGINYNSPSSLTNFHTVFYDVGDDLIHGSAERVNMSRLCRKVSRHPQRKEKYIAIINKKYNRLMQKREKRITYKMQFLEKLYALISQGEFNKFGSLCKKHCATRIEENLKEICRKTRSRDAVPFWYLFCDRQPYASKDIRISHIRYSDHGKPGITTYYKFMYGDSTQWNNDAIPFTDADARWYQVLLGNNPIFLRLEGTGKFVLITGLINPTIQIAIKDGIYNNPRRFRLGS